MRTGIMKTVGSRPIWYHENSMARAPFHNSDSFLLKSCCVP